MNETPIHDAIAFDRIIAANSFDPEVSRRSEVPPGSSAASQPAEFSASGSESVDATFAAMWDAMRGLIVASAAAAGESLGFEVPTWAEATEAQRHVFRLNTRGAVESAAVLVACIAMGGAA